MIETIDVRLEFEGEKQMLIVDRWPSHVAFSKEFLEAADKRYVTVIGDVVQMRADRGGFANYTLQPDDGRPYRDAWKIE